jgi:hypothetical protein
MRTSDLFSIDIRDIAKGLILAVGSAVVTTIKTSLAAGSLNFNWPLIGTVALGAGVTYLGGKFFTPATCVTPADNK